MLFNLSHSRYRFLRGCRSGATLLCIHLLGAGIAGSAVAAQSEAVAESRDAPGTPPVGTSLPTAEDLRIESRDELLALADIRFTDRQYDEALRIYRRLVSEIEAEAGPRTPELIRPLRGLGRAAVATRDYAVAADALERAAFLTRVDRGLHSMEQLETFDLLMSSYLALDQIDKAVQRQIRRLSVIMNAAGVGSEQHLEATQEVTEFLRNLGRLPEHKRLVDEQIRIITRALGRNHVALVPLFQEMAANFRLRGDPDIAGFYPLRRAERILARKGSDGVIQRAEIFGELGDQYLAFGAYREALSYYKRGVAMLREAGADQAVKRIFDTPSIVSLPTPDLPGMVGYAAQPGLPTDPVLVSLSIRRNGHVTEVNVLEQPPGREAAVEELVSKLIRARFRPRVLVDRGEVETRRLTIQLPRKDDVAEP